MAEPVRARRWPAALLPSRATRRIAWALLLALPLLWQLGGTFLFDVDEGAFSEATREMLASGDWGHTTLNGAPRFDKPIGVYWLQALSVHTFGLGEFALRLPSALSCWAMALALSAFAAARWGQRAGALAGVLTVTSLGYLALGRAATADSLLNLLLVLAALDLWRFAETGSAAPLRRAYAWVGLGLLVKGPVAALVPGAAFLLWCVFGRRWDLVLRALRDWRGWLLMLAMSLPWYAYALHRHGMAFVDGFLWHHNLERFSGTIGGHRGNFLYYFLVLPLMLLPWTPLLAVVVARARSLWAEPLGRFLLGWAAFVLVFFSLSGTKLPHYVLYGAAPLVLLMARMLAKAGPRLARVAAFGVFAWAALVTAAPVLVAHFAPGIRDPLFRSLLQGAPAPSWIAPACILVVAAVLLWRARGEEGWWAAPAAGAVVALLVAGWSLPWFGEALQGPVRRAAAAAAAHPGPIVQWDVHQPSFSVYAGRAVPKADPPQPGDMVLARGDRLPPGPARKPLYSERGIVVLAPLTAP
jgi:4-amino-4-deoxy-L-arabinose transferase-like glycosyltransferase